MATLIVGYNSPVSDGDTSIAIVYRLTDSSGAVWRSAPKILVNALRSDLSWGSGQWIVIPTLRHLMDGTTAQIEVYQGAVDLQRYRVIDNDPTKDYIEFCFTAPVGTDPDDVVIMPTVAQAIAASPVGEDIYTTGNALPNDPPPQLQAVSTWRNRAIGGFGNWIWVSQEFATGIGVQWSTKLRSEWLDGTGDILGIGMIDWNYCAIFKRDAIGIISGAGPDGMGHGNFIVQTLATKAGCWNPASIVNGADGCYYQDAQTGRIMLLGSDLQVKEACPGAFDMFEAGARVTAALHVEAKRQVWFLTATHAIVLDYKHRTERSPLGSVYTWPRAVEGGAVGAAIVGLVPTLMCASGNTEAQVAGQAYDLATNGTTKTAINRTIETGDISPLGLQRMFNVSRLAVLAEWVAAHTMTLTVYPNYATSGTPVSITLTAAPGQILDRPAGCMRVQAVRFKLVESTYAPGGVAVYGAGSKFVGFALELQDHGKLQLIDAGRIF
jgi:hypothetical protein